MRPRAVKEEALPKKCPKCTFLKPPKMHVCPCCGFAPVVQNKVVHQDGELVELASRRTAIAPPIADRVDFYRELRAVAQMRGYKDGWVAHKFKAKVGRFPPWNYRHLAPAAPSDATLRWLKSQDIRWARSGRLA